MNCDMETGICEVAEPKDARDNALQKPVRLLYFTDPICSSCWGIDPQLRKLEQEYGDYFQVEYRMGGLLKSWTEYGGSDVNGPASVAGHWEEAGEYYEMPVSGDVWRDDPLHSSFPPSVAFKAAQLQGDSLAARFLRRIKEMVFVEKKNITTWEHLAQAAEESGLDGLKFKNDFENAAPDLFGADLELAKEWGVRGFPTIFFIDDEDNRFKVYGSKPYEVYEQALLKLVPSASKKALHASAENVLSSYPSFASKEFAVLTGKSIIEAESILDAFEQQGKVKRLTVTTGTLWKVV